mgnify:FL=1
MRIGLALYVVAMCALMLRGWRLSRPVGTVGIATLGLACGFLTGAVAMGGLVVATFMAADGTRPAAMRATLIAYFLPLDIYAASLFYNAGAYDRDGLTAVAIALPILAVGMAVGSRHFLRATPEQFRRYTLGLLLVLAAAAFLRSVLV